MKSAVVKYKILPTVKKELDVRLQKFPILRSLRGDIYDAFSAGTIASKVNPYAIKVMAEIGIDISGQRSKSIEEFRSFIFDYVVTACKSAKGNCPFFLGKYVLHRSFKDPADFEGSDMEKFEVFRNVKNEIKSWIF